MRASGSVVLFLLVAGGLSASPANSRAIDDAVADIPGFDAPHVSPRCDDAEFLRRLSLDLLGYPPNGDQASAFVADASPVKRYAKINELLATPRFAESWSRRFALVYFGNYHEPAFDLQAGLKIETRHRILESFIAWFREQIQADRPWDEILSAMITARGNSSKVPELGYKLSFLGTERQEIKFGTAVSRHLLGITLDCASCHDHPYDKWRTESFHGLAAFNTRMRVARIVEKGEEQVQVSYAETGEWDLGGPRLFDEGIMPKGGFRSGLPSRFEPSYLDEKTPNETDRTKTLADLLSRDRSGEVARAMANRVWTWLIGRGVFEPLDGFDLKHPPVSRPLMKALTATLAEGGGSLKALVRAICMTDTYQRTSAAAGRCEKRHFCRAEILPLTGEQLINSVQVALRGAPGLNLEEAMELTAALSMRPQVGCEVQPLPCTTLHALMFRNSERLWAWIRESPMLASIRRGAPADDELTERLFLEMLSRRPSASERARFAGFVKDRGVAGLQDACWILFNTPEFLTRH
jgi:hypothetical protein